MEGLSCVKIKKRKVPVYPKSYPHSQCVENSTVICYNQYSDKEIEVNKF